MVSDDVACHATKKLSTAGTAQSRFEWTIPTFVTPPLFYEFLSVRSFRMVS
jgi:hypothetical protein